MRQKLPLPIHPQHLLVRCYAKREGGLWVAFCVDFTLAAQADTLDEAKRKLDGQIREYVHDALIGADRAHAGQLLTRRAPLSFWLEYWLIRAGFALKKRFRPDRQGHAFPFNEILPVIPAGA